MRGAHHGFCQTDLFILIIFDDLIEFNEPINLIDLIDVFVVIHMIILSILPS